MAKTHYLLGVSTGYPVHVRETEVDEDGNPARLRVKIYKRGVEVGDRIVIGRNVDTCMTYIVASVAEDRSNPLWPAWDAYVILLSLKRGLPPHLRSESLHPHAGLSENMTPAIDGDENSPANRARASMAELQDLLDEIKKNYPNL